MKNLIEIAKLRNIIIPEIVDLVEITKEDIILRIEEFRLNEIKWIENHNYLFDLIDPFDKNSSSITSDDAIYNVYHKYDLIIQKLNKQKFNYKYDNMDKLENDILSRKVTLQK